MKKNNVYGGMMCLFFLLVAFSQNLYAEEVSGVENKNEIPIREDILKLCGYVPSGVNPVMADNSAIFSVFAKEKPLELAKRKFFDAKGSWYSCLFFHDHNSDIGELLYKKLPADFLFSDKINENPTTFSNLFPPNASVKFFEKGFEIESGQQKYHVERIAVLDWDRDGKNEWLLYVRSSRINTPKLWRDYFILLDNLGNSSLTVSNLLIREYNNGSITHLSSVMRGQFQESICQEFDAGEEKVFDSSKKIEQKVNSSVTKQKLSD